jgi:HEAT repeat protein
MNKNRLLCSLIAVLLLLAMLSESTTAQTVPPESSNHALLIKQIEALRDPDPKVRAKAAEELGKTKNVEAVESLIQSLTYDDVWSVRKSAAWALGEIKDSRAVFPLIRSLNHKDWIIRSNAAKALGKIGDKMAVAALTDLLQEENVHVQKGRDNVIENVVWALGEIGQQRSLIPIIEKLQSGMPVIRAEAAEALGKIGDNKAVPHLIPLLKDDRNPGVRKSIVRAFGEMPTEAAVQSLAEALGDENYSVRLHAQVSLEKAGRQAVPFLIEALSHEKRYVQNRAMWALEEITGEMYGLDISRWEKWLNEL